MANNMCRNEGLSLLGMSPAGGCGCKLPLDKLNIILDSVDSILPNHSLNSDVIVGAEDRDDAAVYKLDNSKCMVCTIDFGTPVSNEPLMWGRICAQNALSDVYAMGGKPAFSLSLLGWPDDIELTVAREVFDGAYIELNNARTLIVGGHSIRSEVPFFGLSVIGFCEIDQLMRVSNAKPDDLLVLTKKLGTGVIISAEKQGKAHKDLVHYAYECMLLSNQDSSAAAVAAKVDAATDVSGFGLIGHLLNLLERSNCIGEIYIHKIPIIQDALKLISTYDVIPKSAKSNYDATLKQVDWGTVDMAYRYLLSDAQTSGGLLLSVSQDEYISLSEISNKGHMSFDVIGRVSHYRSDTRELITIAE